MMNVWARLAVEGKTADEIAGTLKGLEGIIQIGTHPRGRWQTIDIQAADLDRLRSLEQAIASRLEGCHRLATQYLPG